MDDLLPSLITKSANLSVLNMQQLGFVLTKAAMNSKTMEMVQFNPRQYTVNFRK